MARLGVDLSGVEADTGGGPLPAGRYQFQAIEESLEANSKGTGEILKLTFEVLQAEVGDHKGRRVWVTMNVAHESAKAQEIGQRQLKALCMSMGMEGVDDTEDLLWKPFAAETKITIDERNRERAEIKKYLFGDDLAPPAAKASATPPSRPAGGAARSAPSNAGRPAAGGGANPLPWVNRQAGRSDQGAASRTASSGSKPSFDLDDDIPF